MLFNFLSKTTPPPSGTVPAAGLLVAMPALPAQELIASDTQGSA